MAGIRDMWNWDKMQEMCAEGVIKAYADWHLLTHMECNNLGIPEGNCNVLQEVLGLGSEGTITDEEQKELAGGQYPFPEKFIEVLVGIDGKKALRARVKWLAEGLDLTNYHARKQAADDLRRIGPDAKDTAPALTKLLKDKNEVLCVRKEAAHALAEISPNTSIPILIEVVKDKDENLEMRIDTVYALAEIGRPAVPALAKALQKIENQRLLRYMLWQMVEIGHDAKEAAPVITKVLKDKDVGLNVRAIAARLLAKISPDAVKTAIPTIVEVLKNEDEDWNARKDAAYLLGKIGPPAVPTLLEVIENNEDTNTRRLAIYAIGIAGPAAAAGIPMPIEVPED